MWSRSGQIGCELRSGGPRPSWRSAATGCQEAAIHSDDFRLVSDPEHLCRRRMEQWSIVLAKAPNSGKIIGWKTGSVRTA